MRISMHVFALVLFNYVQLFAAEMPSRDVPARCAEPYSGAIVLCGSEEAPEEVIRAFVQLAKADMGNLVVITWGSEASDTATSDLEAKWRALTKATISVLHASSAAETSREEFLAPLRTATGIWFAATAKDSLITDLASTKLVEELRATLARGGAVGGTSAAGTAFGDLLVTSDSPDKPKLARGLGLLKDLIFAHGQADGLESQLHKVLTDYPCRVGVNIGDDTTLIVRGREMKALGNSTVSFGLAPSKTRPARTITIKAGEYEDLTALRRAALERAGKPFPEAAGKPSQVPNGSLVIVGGGRLPMDIRKKFLELCGGPEAKIVVIPIASNPPQVGMDQTRWLKELGAKNVVLFDPQSRSEAESPESMAKLKDAGGIWFGGGRQWRTVDMYEGTACVPAFHEVLRRDGAIGGSSAGATIQGEYLVRGSPLRNTIMMAEGYERGFGFLPNAAIDQHFTQRKRQPDMEELKQTFPQLLGLGIDEGTAVIVRGAKMEAMGEATVSVYPPLTSKETEANKPDSIAPLVIKAGESLDLSQLTAGRDSKAASGETNNVSKESGK